MIVQKSPKPAIVQKVFVKDGDNVLVGAAVLVLNSEEEQSEILKVERQAKVVSAQLENVTDPIRSERLAIMERMISASNAAAQNMADEIAGQEKQIRLVEALPAQVIPYRKQLLQARLKHIKAKIERDGYELNSSASAKHLGIVLSLLQKEKDHFLRAVERLTILAPSSGKIRLNVGEGSPCAVGFALFTIE